MSDHHANEAHGSVREYVVGLILSIILTIIPFSLVSSGVLTDGLTIVIIMLCALAQVFVQLVFFLHMNLSSRQLNNNISTALVVTLIAILVVGSVWIMRHLNHNMLLGQ